MGENQNPATTMKITAITRYKHGELYAILKRLGWSQAELARQSGLQNTIIGDVINLLQRPSIKQANAIQMALGKAGEFLDVLAEWPATFAGIKKGYKVEATADIPMDRMLDHPEMLQIAAPEEYSGVSQRCIDETIDEVIGELSENQQIVLRERFWNRKSLEEVGEMLGTGREGVRQIELKSLRLLRHPSKIKKLKGLLEELPTYDNLTSQS